MITKATTKIPVRNFYYLLCYAWDRLAEARVADVGADGYAHLANLFARVLVSGLEHLLKRGLDQGYREHRDAVAGVRGKIDFAASVKGHLFPLGRAACVFEELTHDVVHNRILKRTVRDLLRADDLDPKLADLLRACLARMTEVSDLPHLDAGVFGRVQLHGNNGFYDFLLRVCRLVHEAAVPDERSGRTRFRDFERDDRAMAGVFERFLLNFYKREQAEFPRVWSESLKWQETAGDEAHLAFLPQMRTDVSMERPGRKVVVDAKYYREPLARGNFGKDTVRSGHLYQLFAYLQNLDCQGQAGVRTEGILLYPLVDTPLDLRYTIQGHRVRVATVDLGRDWREIHAFLRDLISDDDGPFRGAAT